MKAAVFSGTSDGRQIAEYLSKKCIDTVVLTATEYGKELMPDMPYVTVHSGRMEIDEMCEFTKCVDIVIDATHPYAVKVTENIRSACKKTCTEYIRLLRKEEIAANVKTAANMEDAAKMLENIEGEIFFAAGSKELEKFSVFADRMTVRALPTDEAKRKCRLLGIKKVILKKGPFSYEDNLSDFKESGCKILVTKNSGREGGFFEKIKAAEKLGMKIVVVERPKEEDGFFIEEIKREINKRLTPKFPLFISLFGKKVLVVGGGNIALRRISILKKYGADIKAIADKFIGISDGIELVERKFRDEDITDDFYVVVAATDDREVNHRIYEICREKNIFVSVADNRAECTFYFPAVCLNDDLSIGIVSRGDKHSLVRKTAAEIRRVADEQSNKDRQQREQACHCTDRNNLQ